MQTLAEVKESVLAAAKAAKDAGRIVELVAELDHKLYTLDEPLVFSAKENPELKSVRLSIRAAEGMRPVVWSNKSITEPFTKVEGTEYYVCQLSKDENGEYPKFRDLYMNMRRMRIATSPEWRNPFPLLPEERDGKKELEGIYIPYEHAKTLAEAGIESAELKMYVQWEHTTLHATGVDLAVTREHEGKKYALMTFGEDFKARYSCGLNRCNNTGDRETFITNALGFLTEPGTYVYDWTVGKLYVIPKGDIKKESYAYGDLENLFIFREMENVTVKGLTFTGLTSKFVCDRGYQAGLFNTEREGKRLPHAAVMTVDAIDFALTECLFKGFGSNAIQLRRSTRGAYIANNRFLNVGMSAIYVGSYHSTYEIPDPRTVSDELRAIVRAHISYNVRVENNYFEHIGYDYPNANCVHYYFVDGMKVLHNTIMGCAYSGVSSGTGWRALFVPGEFVNVRNVEVAYNRIHNFMDRLRDGAAIYTIGANAITGYNARFSSVHHNYVSLENSKDHDRRGIYLDGSTTGWEVYENVVDNSLIPLFNQYHVTEQFTHHIRIDNFYSTTPVDMQNNAPHRDSILLDFYVETAGIEALCEKYEGARAICEGAGCHLDI